MRINLNRLVRLIIGLTYFLVFATVPIPSSAQQGGGDSPSKLAVWLTGEPGQPRAGVVFLRQQKKWVLNIKDGTIVAVTGRAQWDLSTPVGFMNFVLVGNQAFPIVSATGSVDDATAIGLSPLVQFFPFSIKINAREDVFSQGSKVGTQTTKGRVGGFLVIDASGGAVLLPLSSGYSAAGTIVTSVSGAGKQKEMVTITGTALSVLNGKLALALLGSTETGQHVTYVMPGVVDAASTNRTYTGSVSKSDNFEKKEANCLGVATDRTCGTVHDDVARTVRLLTSTIGDSLTKIVSSRCNVLPQVSTAHLSRT